MNALRVLLFGSLLLCPLAPLPLPAEVSVTSGEIAPLRITAHTGMKPQSKLWRSDGYWWGVFADSTGTHIWRMGGDRWIQSTTLSKETDIRADVLASDRYVEILLFRGQASSLVRCYMAEEYKTYGILNTKGTGPTIPVELDPGVETATIARDGDGRLWIASDGEDQVNVRWLDPQSETVSGPYTLATGITNDDICVVSRLSDGDVGVLWSNQNRQRYGFRRHASGGEPDDWFPDEIPADGSAIDHGEGMSDDHLSVSLGSDGTLYATVKTSYDTDGMPLVACLVRGVHHRWDPLYHVDDEGSRGVTVLDETKGTFAAVYTSYRDNSIVLKYSSVDTVSFSDRITLIEGTKLGGTRINNVSVPRTAISGRFPIIASQGDSLMHTVMVEFE